MAVYSGDNSFNGSGSPEIAITYSSAAKLIATVTLSANQNPSPAGAPTVFTATVTPPAGTTTVPTGPVLLYDGSTLVTIVNLANGVATLSDTFTASGSHAMTATYLGDNNYSQVASAVLTETVGGSTPVSVSLTSSAPNSVYGQSVQLTISVVPALATGTIQLAVDGSVVPGSATLTNGIAVAFIPQTLGAGTHTIVAAYSGDANNQPATSPGHTNAHGDLIAESFGCRPVRDPDRHDDSSLQRHSLGTANRESSRQLERGVEH
jgi:hypothetical protein